MGTDREVKNLVLYDGACKFCNRAVGFILEHEQTQELTFAPLRSELGQFLLRRFGLPPDYTDSLLFLYRGKLLSRSKAVFHIAKFLRRPWRWVSFLRFLPPSFTNLCYGRVAGHRYRFMGAGACAVPAPDAEGRFLE